jgi:hypothetical protein
MGAELKGLVLGRERDSRWWAGRWTTGLAQGWGRCGSAGCWSRRAATLMLFVEPRVTDLGCGCWSKSTELRVMLR